MSTNSRIEWTDATWNPVRGCTKISPGCAHCYAETFAERFRGVLGHPYEQGFDLRLVPGKVAEPLTWAFVIEKTDYLPSHARKILTQYEELGRIRVEAMPDCNRRGKTFPSDKVQIVFPD